MNTLEIVFPDDARAHHATDIDRIRVPRPCTRERLSTNELAVFKNAPFPSAHVRKFPSRLAFLGVRSENDHF
jgi:hypothetical protein